MNLLNLGEGENLAAVMSVKNFEEGYLFFTTLRGIVKRTRVAEFQNIRANGIRAVSLREDDQLHSVKLTDGQREIIIGASNGKAIRFHEDDVRDMGRNAAGVKGIELEKDDEVIGVTAVTDDHSEILVISEKGYGKRTVVDEYRLQGRGGKGVKTINVTEKNGILRKLVSVDPKDDLLVVTDKGMIIRVPIGQIAQTKRSTQGVRIINLVEHHCVATIAIVPCEEECDNEEFEGEEDVVISKVESVHIEKPQVLEFDEEEQETVEEINELMGESY